MSFNKIILSVFALILFAAAATAQDPVPIYPENYKVLLENERVRVLDFQQVATAPCTDPIRLSGLCSGGARCL